jgi:hypothetical protein
MKRRGGWPGWVHGTVAPGFGLGGVISDSEDVMKVTMHFHN